MRRPLPVRLFRIESAVTFVPCTYTMPFGGGGIMRQPCSHSHSPPLRSQLSWSVGRRNHRPRRRATTRRRTSAARRTTCRDASHTCRAAPQCRQCRCGTSCSRRTHGSTTRRIRARNDGTPCPIWPGSRRSHAVVRLDAGSADADPLRVPAEALPGVVVVIRPPAVPAAPRVARPSPPGPAQAVSTLMASSHDPPNGVLPRHRVPSPLLQAFCPPSHS